MRFRSGIALFCLSGLACLNGFVTAAKAQQVTLPSGWQQLSNDKLATWIRTIKDNDQFDQLSMSEQEAVKVEGRTRFLQLDLAKTALSYQTIEMLHWVTRHELPPNAEAKAKAALLARPDDWTDQPYAEIRSKIAIMMRLKFDESSIVMEGRRWVAAGGTQDQVPSEDMIYPVVSQVFSNLQVIRSGFTAEWNGLIKAPQTGGYLFLISPINVNSGYSEHAVKLSLTVSVNNQTVLNSSPNKNDVGWNDPSQWVSESGGVALTAGQPVALKVVVTVEPQQDLPDATLHALLFWKVPGSNTPVIVPQANLTTPDGSAQGLTATYAWKQDGQPQSLTRTEPNVDAAWTRPQILLASTIRDDLQRGETVWQALAAKTYLTDLLKTPSRLHPFFEEPDDFATALTTARRAEFLELLLDNSKLLDPVDAKQAVRFFKPFRIGAPDPALEVFGVWATRHADLVCDVSNDRIFNGDQRFAFSSMAILTTQQLPSQIGDLQNRYLIMPDGRCSLPVAYTLACSYLGQKKFDTWIDYLDNKLADTSVTGDVRVNWLIARANAQELDPGSARHYPFYYGIPFYEPLEGRSYLDEALKSARSPAVKLRVAQEIIGRLASRQQFERAQTVLQSASQNLPADQQLIASRLQQQLADDLAAYQQDQADQPVRAQQAHVAELKKRRAQAAQRGDDAAVNRYDGLISAATKTD